MTRNEERAYLRGRREALTRIMLGCARELGIGPNDVGTRLANLLREREEAVAALRHLCAEHGDTDFEDDLWLPDIVEKHLGRHLDVDPVAVTGEPARAADPGTRWVNERDGEVVDVRSSLGNGWFEVCVVAPASNAGTVTDRALDDGPWRAVM